MPLALGHRSVQEEVIVLLLLIRQDTVDTLPYDTNRRCACSITESEAESPKLNKGHKVHVHILALGPLWEVLSTALQGADGVQRRVWQQVPGQGSQRLPCNCVPGGSCLLASQGGNRFTTGTWLTEERSVVSGFLSGRMQAVKRSAAA